jgi:hypothetical protein
MSPTSPHLSRSVARDPLPKSQLPASTLRPTFGLPTVPKQPARIAASADTRAFLCKRTSAQSIRKLRCRGLERSSSFGTGAQELCRQVRPIRIPPLCAALSELSYASSSYCYAPLFDLVLKRNAKSQISHRIFLFEKTQTNPVSKSEGILPKHSFGGAGLEHLDFCTCMLRQHTRS